MLYYLTRVSPQRWEYLEQTPDGVVIASVEATVQRGHVLITIEVLPDFDRPLPIKITPAMPDVTFNAVRREIMSAVLTVMLFTKPRHSCHSTLDKIR